jgi:RNA ligase (TIGR02306 family)
MAATKDQQRTATDELSGRPLAYVEVVKSVGAVPGADRIELAVVRAWRVVVAKDSCRAGDRVVFFEIDSVVPRDWPAGMFRELAKSEYRVKTLRVRGVVS